MSNIRIMSDNLANKIAAGEVVERISSVVKELVENSLDANSKNIVVDLIDSGTKSIKVCDDGCGMDKEDALLCFSRHATSKLLKEDDLFFINTLGFRGEALPSIASVSKVDLKTSKGDTGTHIEIHGGKLITNEKSDARTGTTIEVSDLFYNTPARLKYLKSDQTELSNVTAFIEKLSLSHPDVSFTLTNNERRIVFTSGSNDLLKAIHEIYGYTISSNMIEITVSNDDYDIHGFICKPVVLKSNKNFITTIVNGRIVKNIDVTRAINDGYFTFKPDIKYPVVVLNIETDPTIIDVNIHPSKADIKFSKLDSLTDLLTKSIGEALRRTLLVQEMKVNINTVAPSIINPNDNLIKESEELYVSSDQLQMDYVKAEITAEKHDFNEVKENVSIASDETKEKNEDIKRLELNPVGIVLQTFIIAENESGMYLIDQHAAHERVNYERVKREMEKENVYKKSMLFPLTIEYSASEFNKLMEKKNELESLGFDIVEFGINTISVREHPSWLREGMEDMLIKQIFDILIEDANTFDRMKFLNRVAATTACKMSVRAHEEITLEQARQILHDLILCDQPYNCPHGRPTIIHYSTYELECMFKRVMN